MLLHLAGVAVASRAVWAAARRFLRDSDLVAELLVLGTLIIVAAYLFSRQALGIGYSHEMAQPAPSGYPQVASFLAGHHLRYGLSGYWQADALTLASGNRVQIRALGVNPGRPGSVSASHWESDASWYDPRLHDATFVLLFSGKPGFTGEAGLRPFDPARQIEATFGRPEHTYDLGRYMVLFWRQNPLRRLSAAPDGRQKQSG